MVLFQPKSEMGLAVKKYWCHIIQFVVVLQTPGKKEPPILGEANQGREGNTLLIKFKTQFFRIYPNLRRFDRGSENTVILLCVQIPTLYKLISDEFK